jgi:hypothetical protein
MTFDPKRPEIGSLVIDINHLVRILIDLPPGALVGLLSTQPGLSEAMGEMRANQPALGVRAGVRDEDVAALEQDLADQAEIRIQLPAARKIVELLEESDAVIDDRLQRRLYATAQTIEARAKMMNDTELLARYAKTLEYRSAIGNKAARTRQRNQAAQAAQAAQAVPATPATSTDETASR